MLIMLPYPRLKHEVYLKFIDFADAVKVPEHGKLDGNFLTTARYAAPESINGENVCFHF
jgi:hypothetical protein